MRARTSLFSSPASDMKFLILTLLRGYRFLISPLCGQTCRYYPSCSAYALGAVEQHGAAKGTWMAL